MPKFSNVPALTTRLIGLVAGAFLASLCLAQAASAQSASKRDAELRACTQKANRLNDEANAALKEYMDRVVAQPRNTAWQPETCKAMKASIIASQKRIDWQGRESRTCAEIFASPGRQAARVELQDSNDKKRDLYRRACQ